MHPVLEIGVQEANRYVRLIDRRTLVAALALGLVLGALWPAVSDEGLDPEQGLYTATVDGEADLADVVASDDSFSIVPADPSGASRADLVIDEDETVHHDSTSEKSKAALTRLATSSRSWTDRQMEAENDTAAAFPVRVALQMEQRSLADVPAPGGAQPGAGAGPGAGGNDPGTDGSQDPTNGTDGTGIDAADADLLPSQISPPFPMKSLLLTFAYLIPLTFVGDLVGGSVISERVRSRGRALLATPVGPGQLLAGKTLPYVAVTVAVAAATTWILGAGWMGMAAALPIVAFALVAAVVIGIVAPSQRSLTFGLVSVNVMLSTFLFLPALFTEIQPISFLSPVGLIAASIRGEAITLGQLAYGTVPLWMITVALAALAGAMYREETLMSPGGALSKVVDGIARLIDRRSRLVLAGALVVPIALVLELFLLVFAVTMDLRLALVVFLVGGGLVEELLKAAPVYASYHRPGPANAWSPPVVGGLVGLGFFVAEKATFALTFLGFGTLPGSNEALATFGVASSLLLVLAPLALHAGATSITAWAARRGRLQAVAGWLAAGLTHAAYNAAVIWFTSGGGIPL